MKAHSWIGSRVRTHAILAAHAPKVPIDDPGLETSERDVADVAGPP